MDDNIEGYICGIGEKERILLQYRKRHFVFVIFTNILELTSFHLFEGFLKVSSEFNKRFLKYTEIKSIIHPTLVFTFFFTQSVSFMG